MSFYQLIKQCVFGIKRRWRKRRAIGMAKRTSTRDLPVEILILIFEEYSFHRTESNPFPQLRLSQVCRQWRLIVNNVPSLWTTIVVTPFISIQIINLYLQRSQQHCLDLEVDFHHDSEDIEAQEGITMAWALVRKSASIWRRLTIQVSPSYAVSVSKDLQMLDVPQLQTLQLSMPSHGSGSKPIFESGTPSLKTLQLVGVPMQRLGPQLDNVTHLHLTSNSPIHFTIFRSIVTNMSRLLELTIRNRVVEGWPLCPSSQNTIQLPSLLSLKLSDRRWPLFIPLLSISAPLLQTLSLYDLVAHDLPEACLEEQISTNFPSIQSIVLKGKSTYINDICFNQLSRIFPTVNHLAFVDVDEFFVRESSYVIHQSSIWPKLRTFTVVPLVSEDIICNLIPDPLVPASPNISQKSSFSSAHLISKDIRPLRSPFPDSCLHIQLSVSRQSAF